MATTIAQSVDTTVSITRNVVAVIAIARHTMPPTAPKWEKCSLRSLLRSRQRRRWYALGSISARTASIVARNATT